LCVSGDTKILTKEYGNIAIAELVEDKNVTSTECWNGEEWSETELFKTSDKQAVWKVTLSNGAIIEATSYHKWYVIVDNTVFIKRTYELESNDVLESFILPDSNELIEGIEVTKCTGHGRMTATYCGTEPKRNKLIFNGILTGNCNEITQPTFPLEADYNIRRNIIFKNEEAKAKYYKLRNELFSLQSYENVISKKLREEMFELYEFTNIDMGADVDENKPYDYFDLKGLPVVDETGVCIIAGINIGHVDIERLPLISELMVRVLEELIDYNKYETPYMEKAAKMRRGIGIGFSDVFHLLAKNKVKYNTKEGMELINSRCELASYHMIRTSIQLAKDFGPCLLNYDSKYSKGVFPIDTYNKHVDELVSVSPNNLNWEHLKNEAREHGTRHSSLFANAPYGNSAIPSGSTYGLEPPREHKFKKSGLPIVVPDYDEYGAYYTTAWSSEFNNIDYFKFTSVVQKWWDQALSLNEYHNLLRYEDRKIPKSYMMEGFFTAYYYGHKSLYYLNIKSKDKNINDEDALINDTSEIVEEEDEIIGCESGACSI
jgi:ribonucleotide reductase alpha subunit